jgi:histone acetyltransferase (RNA polymerase elongator complex component)
VDPGKTYGIAILGDNKVLETLTSANIEEAAHLVVDSLKRFPAEVRVVRVGNGPPEYTKTLLSSLDEYLPEETLMEIVSEAGTSRITNTSVNRRVLRDAVSAIKIAVRNGQAFSRKNV